MANGLAIYVFTMDIFHDEDLVRLGYKMDAAIIAVRGTASCSVFDPVAALAVDARWRSFPCHTLE